MSVQTDATPFKTTCKRGLRRLGFLASIAGGRIPHLCQTPACLLKEALALFTARLGRPLRRGRFGHRPSQELLVVNLVTAVSNPKALIISIRSHSMSCASHKVAKLHRSESVRRSLAGTSSAIIARIPGAGPGSAEAARGRPAEEPSSAVLSWASRLISELPGSIAEGSILL